MKATSIIQDSSKRKRERTPEDSLIQEQPDRPQKKRRYIMKDIPESTNSNVLTNRRVTHERSKRKREETPEDNINQEKLDHPRSKRRIITKDIPEANDSSIVPVSRFRPFLPRNLKVTNSDSTHKAKISMRPRGLHLYVLVPSLGKGRKAKVAGK